MNLRQDGRGQTLLTSQRSAVLSSRFLDLICVMERLREECPWDREQTPESLRRYILEEAYEVIDAIDQGNWDALKDELGDFLLQVVFQAKIQDQHGRFDMEDVLKGIVDKMVRRHPHVFSDSRVETAGDVEANWETIKRGEKGKQNDPSAIAGLPKGLPALLESYKLTKKAAKVGFDWDRAEQVVAKIEEELGEVQQAAGHSKPKLEEELGDLLFAVANLVRHYGFEPEETLRLGNRKFAKRFREMEKLAQKKGKPFAELNLEEQEALWVAVKEQKKA